MLLKKIIGIFIIILNIGGLGFLIYLLVMMLKDKFLNTPKVDEAKDASLDRKVKKPGPKIKNDEIVPDEDDLLKDMDLSDLDNLNLDDFD